MKTYCIHTDNDKYYYAIEKNGVMCLIQLERTRDNAGRQIPVDKWDVSGEWILCGFKEVLPFNNLGCLRSIGDMVNEPNSNFSFKNGKGKYVLKDKDHGTYRTWSDRINSIWEVEKI